MMEIPSPILEAVDGAFLVLLFFMTWSAAQYTAREHRRARVAGYYGPQVKAAWSIFMLFVGLMMRVGIHWLSRHAADHGYHWPWLRPIIPEVILVSTIITAWAGVCWIRTVMPPHPTRSPWFPPRCARRSWMVAAAIAMTFGVYMALGGL